MPKREEDDTVNANDSTSSSPHSKKEHLFEGIKNFTSIFLHNEENKSSFK
jgi:hypothetical protein